MTDIKRRGDPRALSCNDGHDLCYCAGRPECHNCGQPLWDDYVKEPLKPFYLRRLGSRRR